MNNISLKCRRNRSFRPKTENRIGVDSEREQRKVIRKEIQNQRSRTEDIKIKKKCQINRMN